MLSWPFRPRWADDDAPVRNIESYCLLKQNVQRRFEEQVTPEQARKFQIRNSEISVSPWCNCPLCVPPPPPLRPPPLLVVVAREQKPLSSCASSPEINNRFDDRFLGKESQSREREAKNISSNNCLRVGGLSMPISRVSMPKKGDTLTLKSRRDVTSGSVRRQNRLGIPND